MGASAYSPAGLTGLLLFLPALVTALYCESLQHQQKMLNAQMLQLLQKSSSIPPECLAQTTVFDFPAKKLKVGEPQLARRAAYEILSGFLGLFSSNLVKTGWSTTAQERFLSALHAQSEQIKRCLEEGKMEPQSPDERQNKLILLRYFRGIRTFLRDKNQSPCAGLIVQLGVRTCLTCLDMLTNRMNSKDTS